MDKQCEICRRLGFEVDGHDNHHVLWTPIEITMFICKSCHNWAEGNPLKYNPTKKRLLQRYGDDKQGKALAVFAFHETYVSLVEEKIQEALGQAGLSIVHVGEAH